MLNICDMFVTKDNTIEFSTIYLCGHGIQPMMLPDTTAQSCVQSLLHLLNSACLALFAVVTPSELMLKFTQFTTRL